MKRTGKKQRGGGRGSIRISRDVLALVDRFASECRTSRSGAIGRAILMAGMTRELLRNRKALREFMARREEPR
jgi:predicted transcriptional regulator